MSVSRGARYILDNPLPPGAYNAMDRGDSGDDDNVPKRVRGVGGDDDDEEESDDFEPIECEDERETREELGVPGPRHKCFGCKYVGQNRAAKIPDSRLREMFQTMADGIGVSWPLALAVQVAKQYETWRGVINETRGERDKLPKWQVNEHLFSVSHALLRSAASVLDHWYNHTCDPQIHQWLHMCWLQHQMSDMRKKCLKKRHKKHGYEIYDKDMWVIYRDAMRQWYFVSAKEPRKLSFFSEGAMIDNGSVANGGLVVRKGRPVYDFFRKGKRQRTVGGMDLGAVQ
jgi:hypothetical protein